jgi:peptidoglycan/LPS O-acetylase OafA/YrhL
VTIKPDHDVDLAKLPSIRRLGAPRPPRPQNAADTNGMLPVAWAVFAGLVGPAVAAFCLAVEPPPANPNAPEPLIATLLGFALMFAWGGAAITAGRRRVSALGWATVVGALSMAMTISCPLSGHHTSIGMWWIGQFIVCGAALAVAASGRRYIGGARVDPSVDA